MEKDFLLFNDFFKKFDELGKGEWITAYSSNDRDNPKEWATFFCALVSNSHIEKSLKDPSWDLTIGRGLPGFSFTWKDGKQIGSYSKIADEGIEPLVMSRSFHGMKDGYWEVSEEFRYYFNLYEDKRNNKFILIDDNGDDEDVISMSENEIRIKTRLIKEFAAAKKMHLAIFFDFIRFSPKTIEELDIKEYHEHKTGADFVYSIGARNWDGFGEDGRKSNGFLMGKKLIPGLKDFAPKMFDYENKQYADFAIGVDENGKEINFTSDEEKLANYFGKNKGAPLYVTPVFFKKEVLSKYYSQPEKYSVEDGYLRCGGMWGLRMDDNHPNFVMVFLGDLGHLSYKEQLYWKGFNVATKEKISYTAFTRSFEGQFSDPENPALFFKQKLDSFQKEWEKKFAWKLFRPLSQGDEHHLKTLRVPLTNEQKEFDEQILSLTKVFIDSLNEQELAKGLVLKDGAKGLDKLEVFFQSKNVRFRGMIEFLRDLQELRSTGVAHLKGSKYDKIKTTFGIGQKDLSKVFVDILVNCITTMNSLENHFVQKDEHLKAVPGISSDKSQ